MNRRLRWVCSLILLLGLGACSSDPKPESQGPAPSMAEGKGAPGAAEKRKATDSGESAMGASGGASVSRKEEKLSGKLVPVTLTLGNEDVLEGSLSSGLLSQLALQLDDYSRKDPENVSLMITYLGVLRLYGQNPQLYQSLVGRTGTYGAKSFWFLMEATLGALKRKEYGLAEYLLGKAEKVAKEPAERQALAHAEGVRLLLLNQYQSAVAKLREATRGEGAYVPAALTLGYLALRYGDYDGAERNFRLVSAVNAQSANARLGLACALRMKGKNEEAKEVLLPLTKIRPRDKRVLWNYALILGDVSATQQEAIAVLKSYQEIPQPMPDLDGKAQSYLSRLTLPPPAVSAVPSSARPSGPAAADAKTSETPNSGGGSTKPAEANK